MVGGMLHHNHERTNMKIDWGQLYSDMKAKEAGGTPPRQQRISLPPPRRQQPKPVLSEAEIQHKELRATIRHRINEHAQASDIAYGVAWCKVYDIMQRRHHLSFDGCISKLDVVQRAGLLEEMLAIVNEQCR